MTKFLSGFITMGIIVFLYQNFIIKLLNYNDLDIIIKTITGIGAILTAWGVYWKWNDEKTRKLYERRLQEVYAPLMTLVIRQEEYRKIDSPDLSKNDNPILLETITHFKRTLKFTSKGLSVTDSEIRKFPGLVNREEFLNILNEKNYGLSRPQLLLCIKSYELLLCIVERREASLEQKYPNFKKEQDPDKNAKIDNSPEGKKFLEVLQEQCYVENLLIDEIVNGYNDCVKKLGLDRQYIDLDSPNFLKNL